MSQILHTKEIGEHIRALIHTNLSSSLGLQSTNLGDIQFYESAEELDNIIPAVFVKPSPGVDVQIRTMGLHYTLRYRYRIIHVKTFEVGDNVTEDKIDQVNSIAELLFNNTSLPGLTLSNAKVQHQVPISMEYEPGEEGFLTLLRGNFVASVVECEVITHTAQS